jgi:hypothetical protein
MVSCCAKKGATHGERRRSGPLKGPWAGEACVLGDVGRTHHCLGPNNRQRNRPEVDGTQRRAMRVRAARPRRNVQQCEQELLHSAAPILTNTPQGLNPKMLPNPSFFVHTGSSEAVKHRVQHNAHDLRRQVAVLLHAEGSFHIVKRVLPSTPIQRWCPKSVRGVRWLRFGSKIRGIV